ncbi:choice-of-anchor A family protein [Kitasatospora sp. NPDC088346]|uniref:choice-of-anchor A family protein n=1 Tax=Kitasatospora sp. NPDC088346 TaxID=3364073 RepID=UPI003829B20A
MPARTRPPARPRRRPTTTLRRVAVVTGLTAPLIGVAALIGAAPLPPPLGACTGSACPDPFPGHNNGPFAGRDASISVFTGGDFSVRGRAAEAEGRIVVLGDISVDKTGGGSYNMGVAGVGSRVPPPDGTDFVTTGGNLTVATGTTLLVGEGDPAFPAAPSAWGNVRHRGTSTGTVGIAPNGRSLQDDTAGDAYTALRPYLTALSTCIARATTTGTVRSDGFTVTFAGDGTSARQVFDVPGDIGTAGRAVDLVLTGIPAGATVLVNLAAADVLINTNTGSALPGDQLTALGPKLMWNFPAAATARITGGAQFQGSVLGGNPAGTTTLSTPGLDGRVYLAGNLVHDSARSGVEVHDYPFNGDLPDFPSPSPSPSNSPSDSASPSPSPSPSDSPSPTPSPSPSEPTSGTPHPSHSSGRPVVSPSASRTHHPLPSTGSGPLLPAGAAAGGLLVAGGTALWAARRRRGRHS